MPQRDGPAPDGAATGRPATGRRAPITVLQSIRAVRATTNPYIAVLVDRLGGAVPVRLFSWREALFGRYDVFHIHWPEIVFVRASVIPTLLHSGLLLLLLARLRFTGVPIVRTLHNVEPHEAQSRLTNAILRLVDRRTIVWVTLNPLTTVRPGAAVVVIPHPHYQEWFAGIARSEVVDGQVGFFGQVRDYKNVDLLLSAFREIDDDGLSLVAGGPARDPALAGRLAALARADHRVRLRLEHLTDVQLVDLVTTSSLIVLPYRELHNSGALILALTLGRAVLVPDNAVTAVLAEEVGAGWVHRYEGALTGGVLAAAIAAASEPPSSAPDLSARDWPEVIASHLAAYEQALELSRAAPASSRRRRR